jgi:DNA-binding CsgD family transcriptional regulator
VRFASAANPLRPRETQVVQFVMAGHSSKEIARQLKISPLTVRKHRENAMRKLAVHTMSELIAAARALGFGDTPSEVFRSDEN